MEQFWFPPTNMPIAWQIGTRETEQPYFKAEFAFSYSEKERKMMTKDMWMQILSLSGTEKGYQEKEGLLI